MATTTYNGKEVEFIDLTPTWEAVLPALVAVLQDGNAEGKKQSLAELRNMAQAADQFKKVAVISKEQLTQATEKGMDKLKLVATTAMQIFWEAVAMNYPEITTGDFPPDADLIFGQACIHALDTWLLFNDPTRVSSPLPNNR